MKYLPMMMALGVGLSVSNTKAILEALFGRKSEFVRTPKYGGRRAPASECRKKKKKRKLLPYVEFCFGLFMTGCLVISLINLRSAMTAPFLVLFAFGFFYVSIGSMLAERERKPAPEESLAASEESA
jgi:hypothetical protein